ncbi:hypothetical protein EVAR_72368_1 [Eumeta japonica]|uniref:Uncharacterized protein n=1 Tax=Eumeta variegata TaxID=151549 RepID=A0A4C1S8M7_EUMVA|nr:hypothetical protein EVAR_72368_1 [Eumeta japonica]
MIQHPRNCPRLALGEKRHVHVLQCNDLCTCRATRKPISPLLRLDAGAAIPPTFYPGATKSLSGSRLLIQLP